MKKKLIVIFIIIVGILSISSLFLYHANNNINFDLVGDSRYFIEVNNEYNESGYKASIFDINLSNYVRQNPI